MDIKAFIRELLFEQDCVIIPGFGGFIGNTYPSYTDRQTGTFYPPVKKISFNRNLNHNDGLLIGKISKVTGINYGNSRALVEDFARQLKQKLSAGETVSFDHIGTFVCDREHNIQFEPDKGVNYLLDSYGLESFQCLPLNEYDVRKRVSRHIDRDPVRQHSLRKNLWRAAVIIPILALLVAIPLKTGIFKTRVETANLNPLVAAEFENNRKAVDEAVNIPADSNMTIKESETSPEPDHEVTAATAPVENPGAVYAIITGSFKSEENALSHVRALKADGFNPEVVRSENGFYRVYAIKCTDLKTALLKIDSLSGKFPGSWISRQ